MSEETIKPSEGVWSWRAQGDANCYAIDVGNNWLMAIQQNGELMPAKQEANMQAICDALNGVQK